jgi:hypothetical protein
VKNRAELDDAHSCTCAGNSKILLLLLYQSAVALYVNRSWPSASKFQLPKIYKKIPVCLNSIATQGSDNLILSALDLIKETGWLSTYIKYHGPKCISTTLTLGLGSLYEKRHEDKFGRIVRQLLSMLRMLRTSCPYSALKA